jgi:hypothetical protein
MAMDMRTRKLHQGLAFSDVEKAGIAWEKARTMHPSGHPKVVAAWKPFKRKWTDFQKIAAPGEGPELFLKNRTKRREQMGPFRKRGI